MVGVAVPSTLIEFVRNEAAAPCAPAFGELADRVRTTCAGGVESVLLYGSCLRSGDPAAGIVDMLVIVSGYRDSPGGPVQRALNGLLPPGVYFFQDGIPPVRCKYAVISLEDFERGTRAWLQPYLWARFAQPSRLLYARDDSVRERVYASLAAAVACFLRNVLPVLPEATLPSTEIWKRGLGLTYGVELRPEAADRPDILAAADADYFERATRAASEAIADLAAAADAGAWRVIATDTERSVCRRSWRLRRLQGPMVSVLRWMKAAFTFSGGVDYAAWKIERHTGVRIEITERLRRHPLVYGWPVLWKLWRSGTLR
ncbi:MAG TPA: hypothetical protein VIC61_07880 [Gammaproteobacteria bacterium]|jgi:hypothetical protein